MIFGDTQIGYRFVIGSTVYVKVDRKDAIAVSVGINKAQLPIRITPECSQEVEVYHADSEYICTVQRNQSVTNVRATKKPKKSYRPIDRFSGYELYMTGMIGESGGVVDGGIFNQGNWRATLEGAKKLRDYRAALQRVRAWKYENCENSVTYCTDVHYVAYSTFTECAFVTAERDYVLSGNPVGIFYDFREACRCCDECADDLKIVFDV